MMPTNIKIAPPKLTMQISSIILAGGRATRMGGVDKGLVLLHQKPLIQYVITRLAPQTDEIIINANREISRYQVLGYPVLQDACLSADTLDFIGPLAGIRLGLSYAQHDYLLTAPCDSPFLPANLATRLLAALLSNNADIAVVSSHGHTQPVFCLCKKTVLTSLDNYLANGGRKVSSWQKSQAYIEVDFSDCIDENGIDAFTNLNTFEDLAALTFAIK